MLGKLLKYELKANVRIFIPLYIAILSVSIINGFSLSTELFQMQNIATFILVGLMVALAVITIVLIVQRFNKNLLGDEGYLMFTLPVSSRKLILSKFISSLIWSVCSVIVAMLSFMLITMIVGRGEIRISDYINIIKEFIQIISINSFWLLLLEIAFMMFCTYSIFVFTVYLALSMGQLPIFNKFRNGASLVSFFVINVVISSIQNSIINIVIGAKIDEYINQYNDVFGTISQVLPIGIIVLLITGIILFICTSYILDKKLNLE
ncbi:MAG: ABC transporter permease [Romboutsia sp.]